MNHRRQAWLSIRYFTPLLLYRFQSTLLLMLLLILFYWMSSVILPLLIDIPISPIFLSGLAGGFMGETAVRGLYTYILSYLSLSIIIIALLYDPILPLPYLSPPDVFSITIVSIFSIYKNLLALYELGIYMRSIRYPSRPPPSLPIPTYQPHFPFLPISLSYSSLSPPATRLIYFIK